MNLKRRAGVDDIYNLGVERQGELVVSFHPPHLQLI